MSQTRPDAVKIPSDGTVSFHDYKGLAAVVEIAEPLLECGPLELAWCRSQAGYYFCTRDPNDTEKYTHWHPKAGQLRYRWTAGPDGTEIGYLISEAE